MSRRLRVSWAIGLLLASGLTVLHSAFADSASSPQSAWRRSTLKADPSLKDPLVRRGKEVFDARCQACHGAYSRDPAQANTTFTLPQMPGTYALGLKYKGQKPATLEERTDLTPELIALFVRRGGGGFMPFFRPTELSSEDLKALTAYLVRKR